MSILKILILFIKVSFSYGTIPRCSDLTDLTDTIDYYIEWNETDYEDYYYVEDETTSALCFNVSKYMKVD